MDQNCPQRTSQENKPFPKAKDSKDTHRVFAFLLQGIQAQTVISNLAKTKGKTDYL